MEPEEHQKIEETVIKILKSSDLVTTTEFEVRVEASRQLGFDLSHINHKKLVRSVVESFLLNEEGCSKTPLDAHVALPQNDVDNKQSRVICKLSNKRKVVVRGFRGKNFVSIREFFDRGGVQQSSFRGINFTVEQWSIFRNNVPAIDEAVKKMQSKLRSDLSDQQKLKISSSVPADEQNQQLYTSVTAANIEQMQQVLTPKNSYGKIGQQVSTPMTSHGEQISFQVAANDEQSHQVSEVMANGEQSHQVSHQVIANGEQNQVPSAIPLNRDQSHQNSIEISRFDGKNYQLWAKKIELFLKQLSVGYVLTDPCPSVSVTQETSAYDIDLVKVAERKWLNDDHICRHSILSSLSDSLYYRYSTSAQSAKELWEELKSVYLYEESETKRSLVKKYIEFQIVDKKSVLDQVHEINRIADSIVASGMSFDDEFHVSTIIAKLPPSWRDFSINLMREEYVPFRKLMDRIRFEDEFRSQNKAGEPSYPVYSKYGYLQHTNDSGSRNCYMKRPGSQWKRQEEEVHNKPVLFCNFCKRKGHTVVNCRNKKFGAGERHYRDHNKSMPQPQVAVEHNAR